MTSVECSELAVDKRDQVLWLTITRENRRNALNDAVIDGLTGAIAGARDDRGIRAIVVTGAGTKAFCAGADLQTAGGGDPDYSEPRSRFGRLLRAARECDTPLIARVNGACMAGGMGLLSMCDLAAAAEHAVFGLPEVKVGLFPAQVMSVLQHIVPRRRLAEICLTGEPLTGAEALAAGLVNYVDADVDVGLNRLLDRLLDKSPAAIRRGLYILKRIESMTFEQSIAFTENQIALLLLSEDADEGIKAFQEKRAPKWTGR